MWLAVLSLHGQLPRLGTGKAEGWKGPGLGACDGKREGSGDREKAGWVAVWQGGGLLESGTREVGWEEKGQWLGSESWR